MERLVQFVRAILAGIAISIGGYAYLSCENKYVGALAFCVGLISVVMLKLNLYTGKIGCVTTASPAYLADTLLSVPGNLIGCLCAGLLFPPRGNVAAICAAKLEKSLFTAFADAVFCGILIYICVEIWKKRSTVIGIVFCVPVFILCGFEHSVADMFYFINARVFSGEAVLFILAVLLGNAAGAVLFHGALSIGSFSIGARSAPSEENNEAPA